MNEERMRLVDDLAGLLAGELRVDPLTITMYSSDASLYQIAPLGVVFPRNRDDVVTVVRYAHDVHLPVIARGAGTGVAGESLGRALIVDFSRFMRRVMMIGDETVRVEPGIVLDRLNSVLRPFDRYFPPDPSGAEATTLGSMLALDAAGSHAVRVGSTRDHVASLEVVLTGGQVVEAGSERLSQLAAPPDEDDASPDAVKRSIISRLVHLLREHKTLIAERQPATLLRNRCGYCLRQVLADDVLHLQRLLVGSEGTLGLFTAATLHTAPRPAHRGVVLILFPQLGLATKAVQIIAQLQPGACDLLDRRLLTLAREADERFHELINPGAEAALIVEQVGFSEAQARDRIRQVLFALRRLGGGLVAREGYSDAEVEFLWSLPRTVVPMLGRLPGPDRPLPFVEDIAVPPAALLDFLQRAQQVFQKHQVISSLYAHAATGQVHFRPFLAPPEPGNAQRLEELAGDLYEAAWSCGGTISGEHGAGLSRTAWIQKQYGPLYDLFREVKRIFDPHNLFNPGKIISDDPHLMIRDLRPAVPAAVPPAAASTASAPGEPLVTLQLTWSLAEAAGSAARCNGCGHCRTHDPRLRMCPLFRLEPLEEASPRSKANLIRGYLDKRFSADDFASARMKQIANLCFNCKQCQLECPSQVDIPHMMIEARAAHVAAHGLSWADWTTSRAHAFARIASLFPWLSNGLLRNVAARWVIEKLLGIARQRKLPTFAAETFLRYARRKHLSRPVRDPGRSAAVYFVDHFANYHDPQLGQALERVLRHHGIATIVPLRQTTAGMASISAGDLDAARDLAERNVRQLVEYAREGIPILCTEPAAALCLRVEYPLLLDHPDVKVVAERTLEAGAFLQSMHRANRLRTDFRPVELDAGYHTPCHLKALGDGLPFMELLSLIPGLKLHRIEAGCSGMAGAWGLARVNYLNSLRLGARLMSRMRQGDLAIGLAECSSCRMQMEHGSDSVSTLHPLKLLAYAYGLMPGLESRWRQVGTVRPAADEAAAAH